MVEPREVVRTPEGMAAAQRATAAGWQHAPWLDSPGERHPVKASEEQIERRCRQRLCGVVLYGPAAGLPRYAAQLYRLRDWLLPPLPYGSPATVSPDAYNNAKDAYRAGLPTSWSQAQSVDLIDQAAKGYERQELRVTEIESRSSGYDGYAGAVAGVAAVGAALLGQDGTPKFGTTLAWLSIIALICAFGCLVLSGFRAWQAAAKPVDWVRPHESWLLQDYLNESGRDANQELLLSLLVSAARGQVLADWKRERFKQASRYFALALIFIIVAAMLLVAPIRGQ